MTAPLFDAYAMVDWSAAAVPQTGADSVWIAWLERGEGAGFRPLVLRNPPTRHAAVADLADRLSDLVARGRSALIGFDFAFGFPAGFAARVCPQTPDWRGVWRSLARLIEDDDTNANNRFAVAATLNAKISGEDFPFWGCPEREAGPHLRAKRPAGFAVAPGTAGLAEFRHTDRVAQGPHSPFKLAYAGSVGSQSLLGIAALEKLRRHPWLDQRVRIWPFETGLAPLAATSGGALIFAEVYPSMLDVTVPPGGIKDEAQVAAVVHHLAALDDRAALAPLFAGPANLSAEMRAVIEREEAWILGIETSRRARTATIATPVDAMPVEAAPATALPRPASRYAYTSDPDEIYRRSFAAIEAEVNRAAIPADLRPIAVRIVHAAGDPSIVTDLVAAPGVVTRAAAALAAGAPILVDAEMLAAGIIRGRLPANNPVITTLNALGVAEAARAGGTTRSAAAVDRWLPHLSGAVVAIGNAPTALFRLLELIDAGAATPAAILGFPVGFVGAAEAKEALITHPARLPFLALRGRRGGSAMAAAAINALAALSRAGP
jgi:precorrin-8X/cobalt-precorrin-8 methylmutase